MEKQYSHSRKLPLGETIYFKTFELTDLDVKDSGDGFYVGEGYANTKNHPDAYGDVPTNYKGKSVYDLSRMKSNPVMLLDHEVSASMIMGKFIELKEDDNGLYFKSIFRPLDQVYNDNVKDAISAYINGFASALSIGGRWHFEDDKNPTHLTKAEIHEISGVAVGADPMALYSKPSETIEKSKETEGCKMLEVLEELVSEYQSTGDEKLLSTIKEIKEQI
jgi:hypothetical protein